jgi:hypothetical protein
MGVMVAARDAARAVCFAIDAADWNGSEIQGGGLEQEILGGVASFQIDEAKSGLAIGILGGAVVFAGNEKDDRGGVDSCLRGESGAKILVRKLLQGVRGRKVFEETFRLGEVEMEIVLGMRRGRGAMAVVIGDPLGGPEQLGNLRQSEFGGLEGTDRTAMGEGVVERHASGAERGREVDVSRRRGSGGLLAGDQGDG